MPAARYWRAVGLQAVGGGALELSALHLYLNDARVDAVASLACTVAPASGALAALQDADTATTARWLDVSAPGFALVWDFGAAQDVNALRLGAGALESEFLQALALQHSSDGAAWTTLTSVPAFAWPGAGAMQPVPGDGDPHFDKVSLLLHFDGADGSKVFTDSSAAPKSQTIAASGVALSSAQSLFGGVSALFNGGYVWFGGAGDAALAPGLQDFCIEAWCYDTGGGNRRVLVGNASSGGPGGTIAILLTAANTFSVEVTAASTKHTITSSVPTPLNRWYHLAVVRSGTTVNLFIDGIEIGAATGVTGAVSAGAGKFSLGSAGEYLGYGGAYGVQWMGHVNDFRYTIGAALYTANFAPPTAPFPDSGGGAAPATPPAPRGIAQAPAIVLSGGASAPAGPVLAPAAITRDMQDSGGYCIYGTTELDADPTDVPVRRRVQLYGQRDGRLVRETWSDAATGSYRFDHIRGGDGTRYFAVAFDHTGDKRAVVADNLLPEVMT